MSIRYMQMVLEDQDYYINNCYNEKDLLRINADILKAREELKELESKVATQYNKITQIIRYNEIIYNRRKCYKGGIELSVSVHTYLTLNGERLKKTEFIYGTNKTFNGNQRKLAEAYAKELKEKYHCNIVKEGF